jgi:hypothetical protein
MFCPQCGAEIASDRVRFCTHCRFPVGSVKEFIVTEVKYVSPYQQPAPYPAAAPAPALPSAQNAPAVEPATNRMKEAERVTPFSVTENTTETLKNKPFFNRP